MNIVSAATAEGLLAMPMSGFDPGGLGAALGLAHDFGPALALVDG